MRQNAALLVVAEDRPSAAVSHVMTLREGSAILSFKYRAVTASGDERCFEAHSRALPDDAGLVEGVVSGLRDRSDRKVMKTKLFHAALTNFLTQLPNRQAFELEHDRHIEHVRVCDLLRNAIEEMVIMTDGRPVRATASGGFASLDDGDAKHVMQSADAVLDQAKRDGRNRLPLVD